jgi:cobalt-zinc-cadmium efflux system outer membrane protein
MDRRPGSGVLALLVAAGACTGCISRDAGYADMKRTVRERIGQDVRWRAVDSDPGRDADETRALLAQPLTADIAVRLALLRNHDVQASFEELGIARARLVRAVALPNPELEGRIGFISGHQPDLAFAVTESLSDLFWLPFREGAARAELDVTRLRAAGRVLDFVFAVKVAFYEREAAERVAVLTRTTRDAAEASFEAAEQLHNAGNIPDLDYLNQQALREESASAAADAEVELMRADGRLSTLLAVAPSRGTPARFADSGASALPRMELDVARLDRRALERSLDIAIARREGEAASKLASLARAEGIVPELRLGLEGDRMEERNDKWALGPMAAIRVPLFYQGQGEIAEAEARGRRATETRAALLLRVASVAEVAGARLGAARARVTRYETTLLPLRRRIVEETLLRYNAMSVGVFQLLQAKRDQIETELRYARSVRDYFVARTEVELLLAGRLPASGMTAEVRPADATAAAPRAASHD